MPNNYRHIICVISTGANDKWFMDINFNYVRLDDLADLFLKADKDLKNALLSGADWQDIRDKRRIVTELSIELHKKRSPEDYTTPAERAYRKH
jgi:hypothetical protein